MFTLSPETADLDVAFTFTRLAAGTVVGGIPEPATPVAQGGATGRVHEVSETARYETEGKQVREALKLILNADSAITVEPGDEATATVSGKVYQVHTVKKRRHTTQIELLRF